MPFQRHIPKEHYKYNDVKEVKSWDCDTYKDRLEDINPEIIIKLSLDGMENKNPPDMYECLKPTEFDAYSKQMECVIQSNLNEDNFKEFKEWIISPNILSFPFYLEYFHGVLIKWGTYKPKYIKLLRQRLYNAFIRDKIKV